jgi:serine/threonine-protein kinase
LTVKRITVFLLKSGLLFLALVVTATVSAMATMWVVLRSHEVPVPSLVGKRAAEARLLLAQHGLQLKVEGQRNDSRVPRDRIASQDPAPGASLKAQRNVKVWLSLGPRRLLVPGVMGESVRTARIALEQGQVPLGRVVEVNASEPEGTVLLQHPPPGETDVLADGVSLLVSRGPGGVDYVMPDLIGRRAEVVLARLQEAGLKVAEVRYRSYPGVAPGIVLRQSPSAGHRVSPRSTVSLDISRAAE